MSARRIPAALACAATVASAGTFAAARGASIGRCHRQGSQLADGVKVDRPNLGLVATH